MNIVASDAVKFDAKIFGENKTFKLIEYLGKKVIIINFFASWCAPCAAEIPILNQLKNDYKGHLFVAVNAAENPKSIKKFLKKNKFNYIILEDPMGDIAN